MTFAQETLMGENAIGKYIEEQKCPSQCSYSSTIKIKAKNQKKNECLADLELVILCGPPKKTRDWVTEATLTKIIRCEAAK